MLYFWMQFLLIPKELTCRIYYYRVHLPVKLSIFEQVLVQVHRYLNACPNIYPNMGSHCPFLLKKRSFVFSCAIHSLANCHARNLRNSEYNHSFLSLNQ